MNDTTNWYKQRQSVLVTMHGKESVIAPVVLDCGSGIVGIDLSLSTKI